MIQLPDKNTLSNPYYDIENGIFNLITTLVITSSGNLGRKQALLNAADYIDNISMELRSMADKES